jgi:Lamin Tail Domain
VVQIHLAKGSFVQPNSTMKYFQTLLIILCFWDVSAQNFVDDFKDSSYSLESWNGDWNSFEFENGLVSKSMKTHDTFGLVSTNYFDVEEEVEWRIELELNFETSSLNYFDLKILIDTVYQGSQGEAVFIRIGGSNDEVALYRKRSDGKLDILSDGTNRETRRDKMELRAILKNEELQVSYSYFGIDTFTFLPLVRVDWDYKSSKCGFDIRQSTASFFGKHRIIKLYVGDPIIDSIAPRISQLELTRSDQINLVFDEPILDPSSTFFDVVLKPNSIKLDSIIWLKPMKVILYLNGSLPEGDIVLELSNFCDVERNCTKDTILSFSYFYPPKPKEYDVVISEFLSDPDPVVGLPKVEFVEILNRSSEDFNLVDWTLSDSKKKVIFPSFILASGEYVIVCDQRDSTQFAVYGNVVGLSSLISLNNSGDTIWLTSKDGDVIHRLSYSLSEFGSSWKKEGGWTREMMDVLKPCLLENWIFSESSVGGTPGNANSVKLLLIDEEPPKLELFYPIGNSSILLIFDSPVSKTQGNLEFSSDNLDITSHQFQQDNMLKISLGTEMNMNEIYDLQISGIEDCVGNIMNDTSVRIGLPSSAGPGDVLLNEVLFNPTPESVDFIEIVNKSDFIFDISDLYISRKDDNLIWEKLYPISRTPRLIFPNEILAMSENTEMLRKAHLNTERMNLFEISSLPSLPDTEGNIGISLSNGTEIDWMQYSDAQHFPLLSTKEGVSLERISVNRPSNQSTNWTSASYSSGNATPGYTNSMTLSLLSSSSEITIQPDPFSPNSDGIDDRVQFAFKFAFEEGVFHLRIFDLKGNMVAFPINSVHANGTDSFWWDGLDQEGKLLSPGIYIAQIEGLSANGRLCRIKRAVTLVWD